MPRANNTIRVEPIQGEALRYRVESWTSATRPHLVDLSENHGNGACSCTDYVTRRGPAIKDGKPLFTKATSCRHIIAARRHFTVTTLGDIAAQLHPRQPT